MSIIISRINLFNYNQIIYKISGDTNKEEIIAQIPLGDFHSKIPCLCYENNIYKVHLYGNKGYLDKLQGHIKAYESIHFEKQKIEIEVN